MINLWDESLGTSFINIEYFKFACGDENPLKFEKCIKYYVKSCVRKQFFAISALLTSFVTTWFQVEPRKTYFL